MTVSNPFPNAVVVATSNGCKFLFSYGTPVAGFIPHVGYFRTDINYSKTTKLHIAAFIHDNLYIVITQTNIDRLTKGL